MKRRTITRSLNAVVAVMVVAGVGCASDPVSAPVDERGAPADDTSTTAAAVAATTVAADSETTVAAVPVGPYASCDAMSFDLVDGDLSLDQLAALDADGRAALAFAENRAVLSGYERSQFDWRVGAMTTERIDLLGIPIEPTTQQFATATVLRDGDAFRTIAPGVGRWATAS